ncbi:MAG: tetratricopeptide repeat protein [Pyrinomonadaceae bacterium]
MHTRNIYLLATTAKGITRSILATAFLAFTSITICAQVPNGGASAGSAGTVRRAEAYEKLLEGHRYLKNASDEQMVKLAQQAFNDALALDSKLAEAHTALAEIAFNYFNDCDVAERQAQSSISINPDNFGGHKLLSRCYVLKSGLRDSKLSPDATEKAIKELREVVRLAPLDGEGWALLGELYLGRGANQEAVDAFNKWTASPTSTDQRFFYQLMRGRELTPEAAAGRLGEVLLTLGRPVEAFDAIRRALALNPENESYQELLQTAIEAGGTKDSVAFSQLRQLSASNPQNMSLLRLLARVEARAGKVDEAVSQLRSAINNRKANDQIKSQLRDDLAQILSEAMRYTEAIDELNNLLKEQNIVNEPLQSARDKQIAGAILESIISLQKQAGMREGAQLTIDRMRRLLGSSDASPDIQYIILLRDEGKRREALQVAREGKLKYADKTNFTNLEATLLAELGQVNEAVALLHEMLKGTAEDYNLRIRAASLYLLAKRGKEALDEAQKAYDLAQKAGSDNRLVTAALLTLASAQELVGDAKGAEESLRKVLAQEPNNSTALNNLGYFLTERSEKLEEALKMIERAVKTEPSNGSFNDSLGWVYFKLGKLDEAERYLTEAARRDKSSATINEHLGDLYLKRGDIQLARKAWQKALSLTIEVDSTVRLKSKLSGENRN